MSKSADNGKKVDNQKGKTSPIDREQVRMLVNTVGYAQAAETTGIKVETLRQWSHRFNWPSPIHPKQAAVTHVMPPADALASIMADERARTRAGFSRAAMRVAEHLAGADESTLMRSSRPARDYTEIAAKAQAWEAEQGNQGSLSLEVLTSEGAFRVVSTPASGDSAHTDGA